MGVREVARSRCRGWRYPSGQPLEQTLERLESTLSAALAAVEAEQEPEWDQLRHLVRFVADWIPDLKDPLVAAMARIDAAVEKALAK